MAGYDLSVGKDLLPGLLSGQDGLLNQWCRLLLIAIDELGYLNLKPEQFNAFFRLMDQRYSLRLSTIVTTNLDLPDWYEPFQNKVLVDALLDRLRHRCTILRLSGSSLRSEPAFQAIQTPGSMAAPTRATSRNKTSPDESAQRLPAPATCGSWFAQPHPRSSLTATRVQRPKTPVCMPVSAILPL